MKLKVNHVVFTVEELWAIQRTQIQLELVHKL